MEPKDKEKVREKKRDRVPPARSANQFALGIVTERPRRASRLRDLRGSGSAATRARPAQPDAPIAHEVPKAQLGYEAGFPVIEKPWVCIYNLLFERWRPRQPCHRDRARRRCYPWSAGIRHS